MKLSRVQIARITQAIFDVSPEAPLFDNVPSDMTWGELIERIANEMAQSLQENRVNLEDEMLRKYGKWSGNPNGYPEDTTRCIEEIRPDSAWGPAEAHQCNRKRGYGLDGLYCKQHAKLRSNNDSLN